MLEQATGDIGQDHRHIAVVPNGVSEHAGLDGAWEILDFPSDPSVLYVESGGPTTMTDMVREVDAKRQRFFTVCMQTLNPRASIELMASIMGEL
ncbi:Scr1 family TA system antitoxin-like transcriptional regulator [Nocardiopsis ansamitocini]|uniref:DUF5753 domain-containing protein n=1 Tax=Nocardiopsis ansamitocini TaxID=1670832 RepID=A0A9W6UFV8_9ACTN|nr:Scr1 family TA system antitoxin-like transcriptional regulator [Nocardiopsis ansamitocini]GLU45946.1 hypothetical protein Nans01_02970 [Nocardiopsis ansamitocini]